MTATIDRTGDELTAERPESSRLRRPRRSPRSPRAPLPPLSAAAATVTWVAVGLAILAVWVFGYAFGLSAVQEQRAQQRLYAQFRTSLTPSEAPPIGGNLAPGSPIALLQIPAVGLHDVIVVEGTDSNDLRSGPGHRRDTPLPGQAGVSVLMARSVSYAAPFRSIAKLQADDPLTFLTGQGTFTYAVMDVRRSGDPLPTALAAGASRVVLVTSEGSGWRQGWAPNHVVYVDAQLVSSATGTGAASATPVTAPPDRPNAVPQDEQPMQGDSSGLFPLVLWLEALVLLSIGYAWARHRWGVWPTWLVGLPVVVAVAWGATDCAIQLLPNLL
jgi:sortase A